MVAVYWIVIVIMLGILGIAFLIVRRCPRSDQKVSAKSGFWAGLVAFVIYVPISGLQDLSKPTLKLHSIPETVSSLGTAGIGVFIGFMFLWLVKILAPTRLVGLIVLILSFAGPSALYTYIFLENLTNTVLFGSLGVALGTLLHTMIFPKPFREIFGEVKHDS